MNYTDEKGFTLAELIITITIASILISILMPVLLNDTKDVKWKALYKSSFSLLNDAVNKAVTDGNTVTLTNSTDTYSLKANFSGLKNTMKILKDCDATSDNTGCWASGETYYSTPNSVAPAFVTSSGVAFALSCSASSTCSNYILIDTNGFNGPNMYGRDRFVVSLADTTFSTSTGRPVQVAPIADVTSVNASSCPSGSCYYSTWLKSIE